MTWQSPGQPAAFFELHLTLCRSSWDKVKLRTGKNLEAGTLTSTATPTTAPERGKPLGVCAASEQCAGAGRPQGCPPKATVKEHPNLYLVSV